MSASPPSSSHSDASSGSWENVTLSPLEVVSLQYDHEIQQLQDAHVGTKHNKNGVDLDAKTGKAAGRFTIHVLAVEGLANAIAEHPVLTASGDAMPSLYVSAALAPSSACEKATKKHQRTASTGATDGRAQWDEEVVYDGVKATSFSIKVTVNSSAGVIADIALGEVELHASAFLDQSTHTKWFDLTVPSSSLTVAGQTRGKVQLSITFHYDAQVRHDRKVGDLIQKKKENDALVEAYRKTAPMLKASFQHPAAFGDVAARAELYIPGNRFHVDAHHPGAVGRSPLPDKTRVVTPFGRGVIVTFRPATKVYVVQLDKDPAAKRANLAYLRQSDVTEEPDEPHLKMYMKVSTPYGNGEIVEIRPHDDVVVVQTGYAKMYMHRKDVKLPEKSIEDMKNKDLVEEAVKLTEKGNLQFRDSQFDDAVFSYLRALGFLQRVDQDIATQKEKAEILQTMIRCHLNIGTCKLKTDAYLDAEIACTNALSILTVLAENKNGMVVTWMGRLGLSEQLMFEDWPSKARFRRAKACYKQGKLLDARNDLMIAVRLNPKDKACRTLLDQVSKLITKQKSEEKKAWGGIFENTPLADVDDEDAPPVDVAAEFQRAATLKQQQATTADADASIFTRKSKSQRERLGAARTSTADENDTWYMSTKVLATASIVTAGMAAFAILALKQQKS